MGNDASDDIATFSPLYVLVFNFTNMHAMSHRSDFFLACSSIGNIYEPAFYLTITYPLTVIQLELLRLQFPTARSDTKSPNTSFLQVIISSKNERVFIHDLSDLTLQFIVHAWWASMNVGSKQPIAWNNSRHVASWRFYLHCGIEKTGSPGIICIICHQVLHDPSEHGTSSMGKHLLPKAHIAKRNQITVSEVTKLTSSKFDETPLASVTNSSNPPEPFRVEIGTGPKLLQWFYHMKTLDHCIWTGFHLQTRPLQARISRSKIST